jgi:hypothetical protein
LICGFSSSTQKKRKKKVKTDRPTHLYWFFSRFSENAAAMAYSTHHPSHPPPYTPTPPPPPPPRKQEHCTMHAGKKNNISVIGDTVISRSFWINHVQKIANFIVEQVIGN